MTFIYRLIVLLLLSGLISACDSSHKNTVDSNNLPDFATKNGNKYLITQGQAQLEINASSAGRISSLKVNGQEMLLTQDKGANSMWGSVLWSSPQSEWSWPPIATLDSAAYKVTVDNNRLVFTSKTDPATGYQFVKSYGINTEKKCLSIIYSIYNHAAVEKNVAGWEVTRLPTSGTVFFPQGNTESSSGIFYALPVDRVDDITWATYENQKIFPNHQKLMTDGKEGWLAYANNGRLLVKEFADVPVELMVAGEGEIELFANVEKTYWEMDEQGVMTKLAPGEHLDWEVLWHARSLPADMKIANGNKELVDFVRGVLSGNN